MFIKILNCIQAYFAGNLPTTDILKDLLTPYCSLKLTRSGYLVPFLLLLKCMGQDPIIRVELEIPKLSKLNLSVLCV